MTRLGELARLHRQLETARPQLRPTAKESNCLSSWWGASWTRTESNDGRPFLFLKEKEEKKKIVMGTSFVATSLEYRNIVVTPNSRSFDVGWIPFATRRRVCARLVFTKIRARWWNNQSVVFWSEGETWERIGLQLGAEQHTCEHTAWLIYEGDVGAPTLYWNPIAKDDANVCAASRRMPLHMIRTANRRKP